MKPIRLSKHALVQCEERGTCEEEIFEAINKGVFKEVKHGRIMYRCNFQYLREWQGKYYAIKQVAPVVAIEEDEMVVVTVYTFYF